MINRYRMNIGETYLDACLDNNETYRKYKDKIVMLDIIHSAPEISRTIETAGDTDGGVITRTYRQKCSVTAEFGLYIYNIADRNAVCQIIKTLASKGGTVGVNDRLGQALYNCVCEEYPEIASARNWTDPLRMTFTTYAFPYWQNVAETVKSLSGKKTSASVTIPGNAPNAPVKVEFTVGGDFSPSIANTTAGVTIGINGTYLRISYPFKKNNYCVIDYDTRSNLRVKVYDNKLTKRLIGSILSYVLPTSDDKLLAKPGSANTVSIDALQTVNATFTAKGAWL